MQVYDDRKKRVGTLTGFRDRSVTKTLGSGDRELSFEYPANGAMAGLLKEEYYIRTKEDEFILKAVEYGEQYNKYTAMLNVEELEGKAFPYGFASETQTATECLNAAFEGTGWEVGECAVTKRRTVRIEEPTTAWAVLQSCLSTYRCECEIDSLRKRVSLHERIGKDRGCYFMEGLNLRKMDVKSDTYGFYTQIIPIGKDGLTIEELHGKGYLENYQYSGKAKAYVWKDERYTHAESLMEDAAAKLEEISKPYRVYTADVADLAKANPEYRGILDYGIGDTVMMVSKSKGVKEKQRVVKIVEYPETPEKNTVELSNTAKTFAEVQKEETESAKEEAISIADSKAKETAEEAKEEAVTIADGNAKVTAEAAKNEAVSIADSNTKKILEEGYSTTEEIVTRIEKTEEKIELGVMHTLTGYYDKEETDAQIGIAKGDIKMEVSQVYQTKDAMGEYYTAKETKSLIDLNTEQINIEFQETISGYYDKKETDAKIKLSAEQIDIGFRQTISGYYDKTEVDNKIRLSEEGIELSASKSYQTKDDAKKSYDDMSARIKLAEDSIDLKVSKNGVIAAINLSSEEATIKADKIKLEGLVTANSHFKIKSDGSMECENATITNTACTNLDVRSGKIGKFTITDEGLAGEGNGAYASIGVYGSHYAFSAGNSSGNQIEIGHHGHIYTKHNIDAVGYAAGNKLEARTYQGNVGFRAAIESGYGTAYWYCNGSEAGRVQAFSDAIAIYANKDIALHAGDNSNYIHLYNDTKYHGTFAAASARRYKKNIAPISEEDAEATMRLVPVEFDYIGTGRHSCGLIADDAVSILPQIVCLKDGEPDSIDYIRLIPYMLKEMQLLKGQLEAAQGRG